MVAKTDQPASYRLQNSCGKAELIPCIYSPTTIKLQNLGIAVSLVLRGLMPPLCLSKATNNDIHEYTLFVTLLYGCTC